MTKHWDYLHEKISHHLQFIYADVVTDIPMGELATQLMNTIGLNNEEDIQIPTPFLFVLHPL